MPRMSETQTKPKAIIASELVTISLLEPPP